MKDKQQEHQTYIENYNEGIKQGFILLEKLEEYDKKTITKAFFEKYFTITGEDGEVRKSWSGDILTEFKLSKREYSWQKGFYIHLAKNNKVEEIESRERLHIIERVKDTIEKFKTWRDRAIVQRDFFRDFKLEDFKKDLEILKDKYNVGENWYYIYDEVKYK